MKRWISFVLAAVLLALAAPVGAAGQSDFSNRSSWDAIAQLEHRIEADCPLQSTEERTAAYAQGVEQIIRAVRAAPDYVPGSLERHGDFFFWQTRDGRANGYSPSLRAALKASVGEQPQKAPAASLELPRSEGENTSDTRDVGVFIPYSGSYYFYAERCIAEGQQLARSTGGALHVYTAENANVDTLAQALESSGILLINSHGRTDFEAGNDQSSKANSSYICLPTGAGITAEDQRAVTGQYGTYHHAFYAGPSEDFDEEYYCVDGTCIANHMHSQAPHSMVWLGCCLGMATEGLFAPLREKGVEAMIGFSQSVTTNADHAYRAVFCQAMFRDATVAEAAAAMKAEVGCPDPYRPTGEPAYPIAVSSQDPYPGRTHLSEGQTVLSTWKLHPAYPISVTVEPAGSAEVRVVRTLVQVTPSRGFTFSDWELTTGEAAAARTGNELDFTLSGPCAVTVRMAARTPAAVRFSAGPGQSAAEISEFIGDTVVLPAPEGELEADAYLYHFLGWTTEALAEDSPARPDLLPAGCKLELNRPETLLHAVYGYFAADDGVSRGQFRRVTQAPETWKGDYVLTYQSTRALRASSLVTGQGIMSPVAVATDVGAGYFIDGDWLNEVPEELVYSFLPDDSGAGPLKMMTSRNYLAVPSSAVPLSTVTDPAASGAAWRMRWTDDGAEIYNARFPSRILQYSSTSSGFSTLTVRRGPLRLYARVPGQHLYTTEPAFSKPQLPCSGSDCPGRIFTDMPEKGHWAHDAIDWAVVGGITAGTTETTFSPSATCTRAQVVTFLWRAAGCPAPRAEDGAFDDVKPDTYYYKAVLWAVEAGVTTGTSETEFSPEAGCTREQVVTFLWRAAGCPGPQDGSCPFTDVRPDSYARAAILWAVRAGVTDGTGETVFSPGQTCTRAQIVTFLYRAWAGE